MKKNITRVDALNLAISALSDNTDAVEVLTNIRDSIAKANTRCSDKPTKAQIENAAIKDEILKHITAEGVRCGDIAKALDLSGQKVSALLRQLKDEGRIITREGEKRVTLFALPSEG